MPRPRLPFTRRRAATAPEAPTRPQPGSASATARAPAGTPTEVAAAAQVPQARAEPAAGYPPDLHERVDGLRAWLAELDRKLGLRTYLGAAIAVLALAAAAVALVLVLSLRQDAATEDDVQSLRDQISGVEQSASQAAESRVTALEQRLSQLEDEVNSLSTAQTTSKRELKVIQDDIRELRGEVSNAGSVQGGGISGSQP
jgi:hypothetical protein